ncbi:MAG: metal-sulfur cluster assembly factor [Candidatus Aenigmatarchaeota archaeon]
MVTEKQVLTALKECFDPELSINIVDLGLIYDVKVNDGNVKIEMVLTSPGCPMRFFIIEDVKEKISKIKGVKKVDVELVSRPWSIDRVSKKVKKKMGWLYGL